MGVFSPASAPVSQVVATGLSKRNPSVTNPIVGPVESTVTITATTVKFLLRARTPYRLEIRTSPGGPFTILWPGCFWAEDTASLTLPLNIYVTAPLGSTVLELTEWERV